MFCVNKDADYDRMIVNPTVVNGRMFGLSDASKGLSPGWLLGSLHLDSGVGLRFHAADLSDFYHSFQISHPRSLRNRVRARFKADELRGLTAFREGLEEPLAIGLRTLAMGDSLAVEVAQSAHTGLLQSLCGSMREGEVLKYRKLCPLTTTFVSRNSLLVCSTLLLTLVMRPPFEVPRWLTGELGCIKTRKRIRLFALPEPF